MVALNQWANILRNKIKQIGRSGRLPKGASPDKKFDEVARDLSDIKDVLNTVIRHLRQGPDHEVSFILSSNQADGNGVIRIEHGLSSIPNHFETVRVASTRGVGSAPSNWGSVRLVNADRRNVEFQFDGAAVSNNLVVKVTVYRGVFVGLNEDA